MSRLQGWDDCHTSAGQGPPHHLLHLRGELIARHNDEQGRPLSLLVQGEHSTFKVDEDVPDDRGRCRILLECVDTL